MSRSPELFPTIPHNFAGEVAAGPGCRDGRVPEDRPHLASWPRRLPRRLSPPATSLWFNLAVAAARFPEKAATCWFGREKSWSAVRDEALALAGWLQSRGVRAGERVVLLLPNCPQFLVAFHAVLRADAVPVPLNVMNRAEEVGHALADSGAVAIVCTAALAAVARAADEARPLGTGRRLLLVTRPADELPESIRPPFGPSDALAAALRDDPPAPEGAACWRDALAEARRPSPAGHGPDDLALLLYTAGTTGLPKGCMHTHRTLMANVVGGSLWGTVGAESVVLGVVPMFHVTGLMYGVLVPTFNAATVVVLPRWERELAGRLIAACRVSHWTCVPTMLVDLLAGSAPGTLDLSSLRTLSGGGAAMPEAVARRMREEHGLSFCEGYGLTETAAPSHANPAERPKLQCLGMPYFGVDSRIVDPQTGRELPQGEAGEIVTRGPMLFTGYWNDPAATAAAFIRVDGRDFFRTGDIGRMDEDGYFFLTDRLKRMINANGFKVWPSEVELLLYAHPRVREACVIGQRDARRGEGVKALVVLRDDGGEPPDEEEFLAWARTRMAAYKAPGSVEFMAALPKSGAGKILWRVLQERQDARDRA